MGSQQVAGMGEWGGGSTVSRRPEGATALTDMTFCGMCDLRLCLHMHGTRVLCKLCARACMKRCSTVFGGKNKCMWSAGQLRYCTTKH